MLGKLNMDEFAMGSSNETSYYGNVINPWRRNNSNAALVPGGSSGGSAAAVAAHICAAATATDTGGSIRQPAAFTGTVGIKPTYGRCSRWGIVAFASSLDQAGPIARDVRDAAIMLKSMASVDPKDTTSVDVPVPDYEAAIGRPIKGCASASPRNTASTACQPKSMRCGTRAQWLKEQGAEIVEISLPHTKYALPAYYIVAPAEASSNLARYDGVRYGLRVPGEDIVDMYEKSRAAGFGREVQRRILIGTYVLSAGYYDAYYVRAQKVRTLIKRDFDKAWNKVDVVLTPATPSPPFAPGEITDPVQMYLKRHLHGDGATWRAFRGNCGTGGLSADGLPMGLQLIGKPFDEETLFQTAGDLRPSNRPWRRKSVRRSTDPGMIWPDCTRQPGHEFHVGWQITSRRQDAGKASWPATLAGTSPWRPHLTARPE
jgi:aspartyl-tRNA(Asn)/glutamyl-tRNA(Gln) amidotransferase subunit A